MFTETIYITADSDGIICIWDIQPTNFDGTCWRGLPTNETYGLLSDNENPDHIIDKYGFLPENGKCYEITTKLTCSRKEIMI